MLGLKSSKKKEIIRKHIFVQNQFEQLKHPTNQTEHTDTNNGDFNVSYRD
jgi:hypothetical protein